MGTNAESESTTFTGGEKFWIRIRHKFVKDPEEDLPLFQSHYRYAIKIDSTKSSFSGNSLKPQLNLIRLYENFPLVRLVRCI